MPVTSDIVESYRRPRAVMRRHLAMGQREDRALMFLMVGCLLIFVASLPALSREAALDENAEFEILAGTWFFWWVIVAPLLFYGLAALGHLVAKPLGGQGSWYSARVALFWTILALSPLWLFRGMVAGFIGAGETLDLVTLFALGIFALLWFTNLREAEAGPPADGTAHEA